MNRALRLHSARTIGRALVLSLLFLPLAGRAIAQPEFSSGLTRVFGAGTDPTGVVVADFNHDGFPDFAVTDRGADSVSVRLGDGNGGFGPRKDYPTGDGPTAILAADLNADGVDDLVVTNSAVGSVTLLRGVANGTFTSPLDFPVGNQPSALAVGDLDGDEHPDVAVANFGSNSVTVLVGSGGLPGLSASSFTVQMGAGPRGLALADFNEDGIQDLVTADANADSISIRLSNGLGGFGLRHSYSVNGNQPFSVALGDLNHDGWIDAVTANHTAATISFLAGTGVGTFAAAVPTSADNGPVALVLADMNGDGIADAVVSHDASNLLTTILGTGGGFGTRSSVGTAGALSYGLGVSDVDGDGRRDVVVPTQIPAKMSVFLGNGAGPFGAHVDLPSGSQPNGLVVSDLDGNGSLDAAVPNYADGNVAVFLNQGNGAFTAGGHFPVGRGGASIAAFDLDGDLKKDLVVATAYSVISDTNHVSVLRGAGGGSFLPRVDYDRAILGRGGLAIGEVTGDGKADLLVVHQQSGNVGLLPGNGIGGFGAVTPIPTLNDPDALLLVDLDGGGTLDLVVTDQQSGDVSLLPGNGVGGFGPRVDHPVASSLHGLAFGDVTGDGKKDLLVTWGSSQTAVLAGDGLGGFGTAHSMFSGAGVPLAIDFGDLNSDSLVDLVIGKGGPAVSLMYGRGGGAFAPPVDAAAGDDQIGLRLADLDGNGTLDLVTANNSSDNMSVLLGRQKTTTRLTVTPDPSPLGSQLTFTATVVEARPDPSAPTGSVRFLDGDETMGVAPLANGSVTFTPLASHAWYRTYRAEYLGDNRFFGSFAPPVRHLTYVPTVGVPTPPASALALAPVRNPSRGAVLVRFTLAQGGPAELSMVDVRGRTVARLETSGDSASLAAPSPGVYLIRLTQGGRTAFARAVVL